MSKTKKSWLPSKSKNRNSRTFVARKAKDGRFTVTETKSGSLLEKVLHETKSSSEKSATKSDPAVAKGFEIKGKTGKYRTNVSGHLRLANGEKIVTVRKDVMARVLNPKKDRKDD